MSPLTPRELGLSRAVPFRWNWERVRYGSGCRTWRVRPRGSVPSVCDIVSGLRFRNSWPVFLNGAVRRSEEGYTAVLGSSRVLEDFRPRALHRNPDRP